MKITPKELTAVQQDFVDKMKDALGFAEVSYSWLRFHGFVNTLCLTYGAMYEAPPLNLDTLMRLSGLVGTTAIDVDGYSYGGCESCDYGSDYGHEIIFREPTKNVAVLVELCAMEYQEGEQ